MILFPPSSLFVSISNVYIGARQKKSNWKTEEDGLKLDESLRHKKVGFFRIAASSSSSSLLSAVNWPQGHHFYNLITVR